MAAFAAGGGGPTQTPCVLFFDNEISHCVDMEAHFTNCLSVNVESHDYYMNKGVYNSESMEIPTIHFSSGLDY